MVKGGRGGEVGKARASFKFHVRIVSTTSLIVSLPSSCAASTI